MSQPCASPAGSSGQAPSYWIPRGYAVWRLGSPAVVWRGFLAMQKVVGSSPIIRSQKANLEQSSPERTGASLVRRPASISSRAPGLWLQGRGRCLNPQVVLAATVTDDDVDLIVDRLALALADLHAE
jgi:hypothetical protein